MLHRNTILVQKPEAEHLGVPVATLLTSGEAPMNILEHRQVMDAPSALSERLAATTFEQENGLAQLSIESCIQVEERFPRTVRGMIDLHILKKGCKVERPGQVPINFTVDDDRSSSQLVFRYGWDNPSINTLEKTGKSAILAEHVGFYENHDDQSRVEMLSARELQQNGTLPSAIFSTETILYYDYLASLKAIGEDYIDFTTFGHHVVTDREYNPVEFVSYVRAVRKIVDTEKIEASDEAVEPVEVIDSVRVVTQKEIAARNVAATVLLGGEVEVERQLSDADSNYLYTLRAA